MSEKERESLARGWYMGIIIYDMFLCWMFSEFGGSPLGKEPCESLVLGLGFRDKGCLFR